MIRHIKHLLISTLLCGAPLFAGLVDAISIVVDGEPITLYEIYKTQKKLGLPKERAVEYLIKQRLKDEELKRFGIEVDDFDVNQEIERIAQQNGIDSLKMRSILANQGVTWARYKEKIKERLLQERLYRQILSTKIQPPSDRTLKEYYELHRNAFSLPKAIQVVQYSAPSKEVLKEVMRNPLASIPGVTQSSQTITTDQLNPQLLFLLTQTPKGEFTQIIPTNGQYVTFLIQEFINPQPIPFEQVKQKVYAQWMEEKRKEAIESHFEKLRAAANIKILRTP
ncbi:MAG: hypothetical protein DSY46_00430 [Hydrogenimonas sp.]|nr:MAG: hypothetical protein DSY46_00430 [Hydrogenimonas sp.]